MSDNELYARFWVCLTAVIGIVALAIFAASREGQLTSRKALDRGLCQQQRAGVNGFIWVSCDSSKK